MAAGERRGRERVVGRRTDLDLQGTHALYVRLAFGFLLPPFSLLLASGATEDELMGWEKGVKGRGAYQEQEIVHWEKVHGNDGPPPVWTTKLETDTCYNAALEFVLDKVEEDVKTRPAGSAPRVGLLAATHNVQSADHLVTELRRRGLASPGKNGALNVSSDVRKRVGLGQLYGMSDDLTSWIASRFSPEGAPMVLK